MAVLFLVNGGISPNIINLDPANYSVEVTDALGCSSISTATVSEPSIIQFDLVKSDPSCFDFEDGALK